MELFVGGCVLLIIGIVAFFVIRDYTTYRTHSDIFLRYPVPPRRNAPAAPRSSARTHAISATSDPAFIEPVSNSLDDAMAHAALESVLSRPIKGPVATGVALMSLCAGDEPRAVFTSENAPHAYGVDADHHQPTHEPSPATGTCPPSTHDYSSDTCESTTYDSGPDTSSSGSDSF